MVELEPLYGMHQPTLVGQHCGASTTPVDQSEVTRPLQQKSSVVTLISARR